MASSAVVDALKQVSSSPDKGQVYEALLSNIKSLSHPDTIEEDLKEIIDQVLADNLGIVVTRNILNAYIETLQSLNNDDLTTDSGNYVLGLISGGSSSSSSTTAQTPTTASAATFLDQAAALRELIATAHEHNEDFAAAAAVLAEMPLDSSARRVTDTDKARVWIRIVRNQLEIDDSTAAETYLNKLRGVMHGVADTNPELQLHFRLSQARVQDARRDFLVAAQAYADLSLSPAIAEEERLHTLGMALRCAVLAPAGPPRSRVLARLFKDERAPGLPEFPMLEKMFLERLIAPAEAERFARGLAPHQLATTADGSTVLARAVVEHNLLAASRLYSNIGFAALGVLLGLDADKAEATTARMIEQGRLVGRIDQIEQVIWFEHGEASGRTGSGRAEGLVGKEIRRWDASTQALMEQVESITYMMQQEFPEFVDHCLAV